MEINFTVIALTALVPLMMGFIWYHPKTFGNTWMRVAGITDDMIKGSNMGMIFGLTYIFSFFLAFGMQYMTIHQLSLWSMVADHPDFTNPESEPGRMVHQFLDKYGHEFRSFKHGFFHGVLGSILIALPVIGINALFERKPAKYTLIHWGYWAVTFGIMGGLVCAFA